MPRSTPRQDAADALHRAFLLNLIAETEAKIAEELATIEVPQAQTLAPLHHLALIRMISLLPVMQTYTIWLSSILTATGRNEVKSIQMALSFSSCFMIGNTINLKSFANIVGSPQSVSMTFLQP